MTTLMAMAVALAATQVYRLELDTETQKPSIVGADGVKREVCLVDPAEYALMTGRVEKVWRSLNATEDGRRRLHGRAVGQEIDEKAMTKTTSYKDGYRHTEAMERKGSTRGGARESGQGTALKAAGKGNRYGEAQRRFRRLVEERKNAKPKTITIEHDATTGKDTVK